MTYGELMSMDDDALKAHIRAIVLGHEPQDGVDHHYHRAWNVANERGMRAWFIECAEERKAELRNRRKANYQTMQELAKPDRA